MAIELVMRDGLSAAIALKSQHVLHQFLLNHVHQLVTATVKHSKVSHKRQLYAQQFTNRLHNITILSIHTSYRVNSIQNHNLTNNITVLG